MDHPMRAYGPNVYEILLGDYLAGLGAALIALTIAAVIWPATLLPDATVGGGVLAGFTAAAGLLLTLAGAGLRQNGAALDVGIGLLAGATLAWLVWGAIEGRVLAIVAGVVLLALGALVVGLRQRSIRGRFKPRFLTPRQFQTMIAVADTMIDGDGREAISSIEVAINTDHLLAEVKSQTTSDIRTVLILLEWVLPIMILRPLPFSTLGSFNRRRAVERVIGAKGLFRDIARSLKVLACAGYYGDQRSMRSVGYRPYDERPRSEVDQTPAHYRDPFLEPVETP
jgi:hypothetical protein